MYIRENNEKRDVEYSRDTTPHQPSTPPGPKPKKVSKLQAENAQLRAELDALKPKPVVVNHYDHIVDAGDCLAVDSSKEPNIKYTFSDGKLVGSKIKNDKGEWV